MLVVVGIGDDDEPVGRAWVGLDHPRGTADTAFVYDIEIRTELRGRGLGRELLAALERAVAEAGVGAIELNVFGNNETAIGMYSSAGYGVTSQHMRKVISD
jgi:ribosomal protein S18 acetylase RimI-like enzyme